MVYDNQDCLHDHHGKTVEQKYRHFFLFKSWICMFASEVLDFSVVNNTGENLCYQSSLVLVSVVFHNQALSTSCVHQLIITGINLNMGNALCVFYANVTQVR